MTSLISRIASIGRANSYLKANVIKNLATHLEYLLKHLLNAKDVLSVARRVVGLQITHNKSGTTQRSVLVTGFQNTKAGQGMSIICNNT